MRIPISLVRRAMEKDITPWSPTAAMSNARAPKKADSPF